MKNYYPSTDPTDPYNNRWGFNEVKSVIIEDGVTSIGNYAFTDFDTIQSITLGSSVSAIGNDAFFGCGSLTTVAVADGNTSLCSENNVLFNKDKTTLILYPAGKTESEYTIPDSVTAIKDGAFHGQTSLKSVTVNDANTAFYSKDGVLFSKDQTDLVLYPAGKTDGSYVVPGTVDCINAYAFRGCVSLSSVTLPENYLTIHQYAFENCTSIESITLTSGYVSNHAFKGCTSLKYIATEDSGPSIYDPFPYPIKDESGNVVKSLGNWKNCWFVLDTDCYKPGSSITLLETNNGTVIDTMIGVISSAVQKPEDPVRNGYVFDGWYIFEYDFETGKYEKPYTFTTYPDENTEVYAKWKAINYQIKFVVGGETYSESTLRYGDSIVLPKAPTKASDNTYTYAFKEWNGYTDGMTVTGSATFDAVFTSDYIDYVIQFMVDGVEYSKSTLHYDVAIVLPVVPTKASDETYDYAFKEWNGYTEGMKVTESTSFDAVFTKTVKVQKDAEEGYGINVEDSAAMFSDEGMEQIVDDAIADSAVTLTVSVGGSTVVFDNEAVKKLSKSSASLEVSTVPAENLSDSVREIVGNSPVFSITFGGNTDFGAGKATVTVPYVLGEGMDPENLVIYYLRDGNVVEKIPCTYENGKVTFATNHLSDYAVMYVEPEPSDSGFPVAFVAIGIVAALAVAGAAFFLIKRRS